MVMEKTPKIERLVYTSKATQEMGTLALFHLLSESRQKNAQQGITGHLLYADGAFTQCIEGHPDSIERLWQSLQKDPRHHSVELLNRGFVEARRFDQWSMAFSSYRHFNQFNMPGFFPLDANGVSEISALCID